MNTKIPEFQPADQWAKQTANDLREDREGFIKSLNAIDVKTYSNPEQALQEYEHLLSILNRRYPIGSFGLDNVSGSAFRDVMDDVESAHTWQQGVTSATEEYDNQIKVELNTTLDTVKLIKKHIAKNLQSLKDQLSNPSEAVQNLEEGTKYPRPKPNIHNNAEQMAAAFQKPIGSKNTDPTKSHLPVPPISKY